MEGASRRGGPDRRAFPQTLVHVLNRRIEQLREERVTRTKNEIAARIRGVCGQMPPEEFDRLVSDMAEVQIKYSLRRSTDLFPDQEKSRDRS